MEAWIFCLIKIARTPTPIAISKPTVEAEFKILKSSVFVIIVFSFLTWQISRKRIKIA